MVFRMRRFDLRKCSYFHWWRMVTIRWCRSEKSGVEILPLNAEMDLLPHTDTRPAPNAHPFRRQRAGTRWRRPWSWAASTGAASCWIAGCSSRCSRTSESPLPCMSVSVMEVGVKQARWGSKVLLLILPTRLLFYLTRPRSCEPARQTRHRHAHTHTHTHTRTHTLTHSPLLL